MEEQLLELQKSWENTIVSHAKVAAAMALHTLGRLLMFKKGDKVLPKSMNLHLLYPYRKLAPKQEGPFPILEVMGPVTYKLILPKK